MLLASDAMPILPATPTAYCTSTMNRSSRSAFLRQIAALPERQTHRSAIAGVALDRRRRGARRLSAVHVCKERSSRAARRAAAAWPPTLVAQSGFGISPPTPPTFQLENFPLTADAIRKISRVVIVAQGTAFHAGLMARNMIEQVVRIPVSGGIWRRFPLPRSGHRSDGAGDRHLIVRRDRRHARRGAARQRARLHDACGHQRRRQHDRARKQRRDLHARGAGDRRRVDQGFHSADRGAVCARPAPRHGSRLAHAR